MTTGSTAARPPHRRLPSLETQRSCRPAARADVRRRNRVREIHRHARVARTRPKSRMQPARKQTPLRATYIPTSEPCAQGILRPATSHAARRSPAAGRAWSPLRPGLWRRSQLVQTTPDRQPSRTSASGTYRGKYILLLSSSKLHGNLAFFHPLTVRRPLSDNSPSKPYTTV